MFHLFLVISAVLCHHFVFGYGGFGGEMHMPKPYQFGYVAKINGGESHHHESGIGGAAVQGSYGYTDAKGIHREVTYLADQGGFKAQVKTNEPGTAPKDPAAVQMMSTGDEYMGAGFGAGGMGGGYMGGAGMGGIGGGKGGFGGRMW
ncbi:cuticle protein 10.9-like [Parasteatoda tepidariorum]|uniref:cuticle protein 10.9-like n=1 Tax=Parasteatoda tepidariorum TaxID=114398 RepID=UPI001C72945C|nr:cuticle protein 10.9-like [Parasteatoda tepidariorum]